MYGLLLPSKCSNRTIQSKAQDEKHQNKKIECQGKVASMVPVQLVPGCGQAGYSNMWAKENSSGNFLDNTTLAAAIPVSKAT